MVPDAPNYSSLEIPGLTSDQVFALLNVRNFAYYCAQIANFRAGKCPFCDPMDLETNPVDKTVGIWRTWPCPERFRAKGIGDHRVLAPIEHRSHIGGLTSEEIDSLAELLHWYVVESSFGRPMIPQDLFELPTITVPMMQVVVPDKTSRVEAVFSHKSLAPLTTSITETLKPENLSCRIMFINKPGHGIARRFIIVPNWDRPTWGEIRTYRHLLAAASYIGDEAGLGEIGGTLLMGLPGAAFSMRFGDPSLTAASQLHLHGNLKKPGPSGIVTETLCKDPADITLKRRVIWLWEQMRLAMELNELSADQAFAALPTEDQAFLKSREK